jgi:hypothetical protein
MNYGQGNQLSGALAGLRSNTTTGSYNSQTTTMGMNPFLKSFQQSAGQNLGNTGSEALKWAFA